MSDPQLIIDVANGLLKSQAAEIERLKAENKRFREAGHRLEAALDAIDTSLMSEQALAADTKAVGGPVSDYSISYDEQAVVNRVAAEVERMKGDLAALRAKMAETAKIVDRYWTFNDNQQHTHTWHDKQDALAAIRKETK